MNINSIEAIYSAYWSMEVPPGTYQFEYRRDRKDVPNDIDRIASDLGIPQEAARLVHRAVTVILGNSGFCSLDFTNRCDLRLSRTASPSIVRVDLIVQEVA